MTTKRISCKQLIFLSLFALASQCVIAAADNWRPACAAMSTTAEKVMKLRQDGLAMSTLMAAAKDYVDEDIKTGKVKADLLKRLAEQMIINAYDTARYSSEQMKARAVEDFRDEWYARCIGVLRPK